MLTSLLVLPVFIKCLGGIPQPSSYSFFPKSWNEAKIFMENDDFENALKYFDKALSIDGDIDCYLFDKANTHKYCYKKFLHM